MIDDKKIEEAANKHFDNIVLNTELYQGDIVGAFKAGINWLLDNLWHDDKKDIPKEEEDILVKLNNSDGYHSAYRVGKYYYISDVKEECEVVTKLDNITRWFYIEDLLKGEK